VDLAEAGSAFENQQRLIAEKVGEKNGAVVILFDK
jgi:hypothetical protein